MIDYPKTATGGCTLTMLGTGNAMCTRCYNTCFFLRTPEGGLMVDGGGGNGIFRQLHRAHIPFEQIRHIFVTHCHTDHILGVLWLIRKISPLIHKGRFTPPLTIYCHDEVKRALEAMVSMLLPAKIGRAVGDTIIIREIVDGEQFQADDMQITAFDIHSTKAKQFGFMAVLPDGKRLACLGDEPYNEACDRYVRDADWMLCEAFCLYQDRERFRPYEKHHSTAIDAGRIAQNLGVKNLLLYHTEDTHLAQRKATYTAEAQAVCQAAVWVPDDLDVIQL